jgi:hypothetical protein
VSEYKGAAAFLRRRLQGVVAHFRGLSLLVTAHELFGAELSLALPDGTTLASVATNTDAGVWQSAGHAINGIPETIQSFRRRCDELHERIAATDGELERLVVWDGQPAYDAAQSELGVLNAAFAAAEEQDKAARAAASASAAEGPVAEVVAKPVSTDEDETGALAKELLALARADGTSSGWDEWRPLIPPAPASLAWMNAEIERQAVHSTPQLQSLAVIEPQTDASSHHAADCELFRIRGGASVQFGDARGSRRAAEAEGSETAPHAAEVRQLPLF